MQGTGVGVNTGVGMGVGVAGSAIGGAPRYSSANRAMTPRVWSVASARLNSGRSDDPFRTAMS